MYNDPYIYLHDLDNEKTLSFIKQARKKTFDQLCSDEQFTTMKADILAQLQDEKQISFCQEHRAQMYHFYQSSEYPKGVYRVCSASSYRSGMPNWRILFSVSDFDELLNDDVYLDGVSHYVEKPEQVLLNLSSAGADAAYTIELNLNTGKLVENGFHFPLGKNHIAWRDADSVWVCPAWDERQLTLSGYPREVWLWRRGQNFEQAQPIYQMERDGVMVNAWRYLDAQGTAIDLIEAATGFFSKEYLQIQENGDVLTLNLPKDVEIVGYLAGQLLIHLKSHWQRTHAVYKMGSLLAVKLSRGEIGMAEVIFEPTAAQSLESVETTKHFIVASILDNVSGQLKAWRWQNGQWQQKILPHLPKGALELTDQPWGGDTVYIASSDFLTPITLFALDLKVMELTVLRRQAEQFNTQNIKISQFHAISADGTAVPYYHIGQYQSAHTPTLVYVYGGFGVPELPHYLGIMGRHWLEKGCSFVLANVRGGGEFVNWHASAQRNNKHKSVDDLLAVVADLHKRNLTSPTKTALQGGSNGGLLVASAMVREPQQLGAIICEVPLIDMLVYTQLSAGSSWIEEYGDPEDEIMHSYLKKFSPYQQIENKDYPPLLITTHLNDDRVHPAHALKFYAKLQDNIHLTSYLYINDGGGHAGNNTQEQIAHEMACVLRFLQKTLIENEK